MIIIMFLVDLFSSVDWKITKYTGYIDVVIFSGRHPNPYDVNIKFVPIYTIYYFLSQRSYRTVIDSFNPNASLQPLHQQKIYRRMFIKKVFTTRGLDPYDKIDCTIEIHLESMMCKFIM